MASLPVPYFGLRFYYAGSEFCRPRHRWKGIRDHWLFHLVHQGRGRVTFAHTGKDLGKGQGFLVPPETEVEYQADPREPWAYSWLACSGPEAAAGFRAVGLGPATPWYTSDLASMYAPEGQFQRQVSRLSGETDAFLQASELVAAFACLRHGSGPNPRESPPGGEAAEGYATLVDDFIQRNFSRPDARVEAWAHQVGLSRKHLSEIVRLRRGASPRALLTEYRLNRASELLVSTALPVGAVAASVGYGDPLAFSRAFRERFRLSPRQWRQTSSNGTQPRFESL